MKTLISLCPLIFFLGCSKETQKTKAGLTEDDLLGKWEYTEVIKDEESGVAFEILLDGFTVFHANGKFSGITNIVTTGDGIPGVYPFLVTVSGTWDLGSGVITSTLTSVNSVPLPGENKIKEVSDSFENTFNGTSGMTVEEEVLSFDGENLVTKDKAEGWVTNYKRSK